MGSKTNRGIVSNTTDRGSNGATRIRCVGAAPKLPYTVGQDSLMDGQLRRAGGIRPDSEFLDPVTERVGMKIEYLRSAIRTLDFAPRFVKSREDVATLNFKQRRQSRCGFRSDGVSIGGGCVLVLSGFRARYRSKLTVQPQDGFRRNNDRTLNHILQLPDVAGPRIIQKVFHRFAGNAFHFLPESLG